MRSELGSAYSGIKIEGKRERGQDGLDVKEKTQAGWRKRDRDWMERGRGKVEVEGRGK